MTVLAPVKARPPHNIPYNLLIMISFSNIWITLLNIFKYLYMCFLSCWVWVTPFPYAQPTQSHQRFHTPVKHSIFV